MLKLLNSVHIGLVLLMLLYTATELWRLLTKLIAPENEAVLYWKPGVEMGIIAVAFVVLIGILTCSTGLVKTRTRWLPAFLHGSWLLCLTWYGWFSIHAPFRLHELVRVEFGDPEAVRRAETAHTVQSVAVYLAIAVLSSFPMLLQLSGRGGGGRRERVV